MQNKPNFPDDQMNVTSLITVEYENIANWTLGENKPNQTQFQKVHKVQARNAEARVKGKMVTYRAENKV